MGNSGENTNNCSGPNNLCVGVIAGVLGIKGAVRIKAFTHMPQGIGDFRNIEDEDGRPVRIKVLRLQKGFVIARIIGVSDRETAKGWAGKSLFVSRSSLPQLEDDEYYYADLIGVQVESLSGAKIGNVVAVHEFGAGGILEVEDALANNFMIPFTSEIVPTIDLPNRRLVIDPDILELV